MAEKSGELNDGFDTSDEFDSTGAPIISSFEDAPDVIAKSEDDDEVGETEQIKAQIQETRSQLGETIDAIQDRLSLQNISEQVKEQVSEQFMSAIGTAKETVYDATLGKLQEAGKFMKKIGKDFSQSEAGKMARNNPLPLILIGLGVGLLAYQGFGSDRRTKKFGGRRDDLSGRNFEGSNGEAANGAFDKVSETASNAVAGVRDAADSTISTVTTAAGDAYRKVGDYAGTAYEKAGEYGTQARDQYNQYVEEYPLAVGAVALAVGAAVGLAIPTSRYESEYMGDYSRQVLDQAQSTAGDLIDRVKEVAGEAKNTIADEANKQGFTA